MKKPIVAVVVCGGLLESNRKLYRVLQRIAFAFGFWASVSELQVNAPAACVWAQGALLNPVFPTVPSADHPGC